MAKCLHKELEEVRSVWFVTVYCCILFARKLKPLDVHVIIVVGCPVP